MKADHTWPAVKQENSFFVLRELYMQSKWEKGKIFFFFLVRKYITVILSFHYPSPHFMPLTGIRTFTFVSRMNHNIWP